MSIDFLSVIRKLYGLHLSGPTVFFYFLLFFIHKYTSYVHSPNDKIPIGNQLKKKKKFNVLGLCITAITATQFIITKRKK